jgi:hypothetical protein
VSGQARALLALGEPSKFWKETRTTMCSEIKSNVCLPPQIGFFGKISFSGLEGYYSPLSYQFLTWILKLRSSKLQFVFWLPGSGLSYI